jgi:hypothetical protein
MSTGVPGTAEQRLTGRSAIAGATQRIEGGWGDIAPPNLALALDLDLGPKT